MPDDQTQSIDIDERLAKAAELNLEGDDSDDDDIQMGAFDLEADLRGDKPSPADLRGSLGKRQRAEEESDDLEPLADDDDEEEELEEEVVEDAAPQQQAAPGSRCQRPPLALRAAAHPWADRVPLRQRQARPGPRDGHHGCP